MSDEAILIRNSAECVPTGPGTIYEDWAVNRMAAAERPILEAVAAERERTARRCESLALELMEVRTAEAIRVAFGLTE